MRKLDRYDIIGAFVALTAILIIMTGTVSMIASVYKP